MNYRYSAQMKGGRHESGAVEAATKDEAIARLRNSGLTGIRLDGQLISDTYQVSPEAERAALSKPSDDLHRAALDGNIPEMKRLIAGGADVNGKQIRGEAPLEWAVGGYKLEAVKLLLDHGADVNLKGPNGVTPLLQAVLLSNYEHKRDETLAIIKELVARGADMNAKSNNGTSAFDQATTNGRGDVLDMFATFNRADRKRSGFLGRLFGR